MRELHAAAHALAGGTHKLHQRSFHQRPRDLTCMHAHTPAVCQLVPALVSCNAATDLGQHLIAIFQCVARGVAMRDLWQERMRGS